MVYDEVLKGRYVSLKSCAEDDAEFTLALRKDPEFIKYLPAIDNTVEQQKEWIRYQRGKEGDYFFVVWDKENTRIGTISIYGIDGSQAESGRLAIKGSIPFEAVEAQILCFRFAFGVLGVQCITGFIYADNERGIRFNRQFGGRQTLPEIDETGRMIIRFEIRKEDFDRIDRKLSSILYRDKEQKRRMQ